MLVLVVLAVLSTVSVAQEPSRKPRKFFDNRVGGEGRFRGRFARRVPAVTPAEVQLSPQDVLAGRVPPAAPVVEAPPPRTHKNRSCNECSADCARSAWSVGWHDDCDKACLVEWFCPEGKEEGCRWTYYRKDCPHQDRRW